MPNELTKIPLTEVQTVRDMLKTEGAYHQIATVAASMVDAGRMVRGITLAFQHSPLIASATPLSFLGALMTSASLGLYPNTVLGDAYLVPFRNGKLSKALKRDVYDITLIVGYRGLVKLARRSGGLLAIHADIATRKEYADGNFTFEYGSNAHLMHRAIDSEDEPLWAYCYAKLQDGEAFIVWPYTKVLSHRDRFSQAYRRAKAAAKKPNMAWMLETTPWVMHEQAMARKTMVRRLCPMLDLTVEGEAALAIDENNRLAFSRYALEQNLSQGDLPEPLTDEETDDQDEGGAPDAEIIEDEGKGAGDDKGAKAEPDPARKPATTRGKSAGPKSAGKGKGKPVGDLAGKKPAKGSDTPAEPNPAAGQGSPAKSAPRASRARAKPAEGENGDLFQSGNGPSEEDMFSDLAEKIRAELAGAKDANGIAAVLGLYDPQLRDMSEKFPEIYLTVDEAADARLASFGGNI
jgi:recombination protein RecT